MNKNQRSPLFGNLILAGFKCTGITYITLEHLRKAKKNILSHREYLELWKLLYDILLLWLLDFQADYEKIEKINSSSAYEIALYDTKEQVIREEIVRYYFYEYGFICPEFYKVDEDTNASTASSTTLLIALGWILVSSNFFEHQKMNILRLYTGQERICLPPYSNDITLTDDVVQENIRSTVLDLEENVLKISSDYKPLESQTFAIQCYMKRLTFYVNGIRKYNRYYTRMVIRLTSMVQIPLIVLDCLMQHSNSKPLIQVIEMRMKMFEQEEQFYKWINSVMAQLKSAKLKQPLVSSIKHNVMREILEAKDATHMIIQEMNTCYNLISQLYKQCWISWKKKSNNSSDRRYRVIIETRTRDSMQLIYKQELNDLEKLLCNHAIQHRGSILQGKYTSTPIILPSESDLSALQVQLDAVLSEIGLNYCKILMK